MNFSGEDTSYGHKWAGANAKKAGMPVDQWMRENPGDECIQAVKIFEAQWSNCPVEIEYVVKQLWQLYEYGNDHYYIKTSIKDLMEMLDDDNHDPTTVSAWKKVDGNQERVNERINYQLLIDFLRSKGLGDTEKLLIHWWW